MSLNSNKKQHLLVRVVRDKIELTGFYVDKKISIKFPAKSFENLSNLKKADFEDTISKTLKTNKLTDIEAIIFVSDEIAFSKTINKLTEENISQQTLKFNNEIPYEADNVFIQKFKKDDKLYLLGSNKSLLNRIYTVFEKNNITMSGVFFESALLIYGVMIDTKNDNFTEKLLNDAKLVNFYKTKKPKKSKLSKKTLAILLVLILLFSIGGFGVMSFYNKRQKDTEQMQEPIITEQTIEENVIVGEPLPVVEEEVIEIDKIVYKINVQNGTLVAGLAGQITNEIKLLGFTNATASNASTQDNEVTLIKYKEGLEPKVIDELTLFLSDKFTTVESETLDQTDTSDIIIILGSQK